MIESEDAVTFRPIRDWLIQRRIDLGLERSQVAHKMGLRRPDQLRAWEMGDHVPTVRWLARWADALAADLTVILRETA